MQLLQCSIFHNLLRTFSALQVLLDIPLLTWGASEDYEIVVKTLNSGYSLWINFLFVLFRSGQFHNVVSTFTNVVKLDVENDNVVSTLSNVVHVNVEIHNVDSTLLDVVNFNVEIHNVVSTLIWRYPTSRRRINQKTTLKRQMFPGRQLLLTTEIFNWALLFTNFSKKRCLVLSLWWEPKVKANILRVILTANVKKTMHTSGHFP